jgi:hypothetical protein
MIAESGHGDEATGRAARLRRWAERQARTRARPRPAWRTMAAVWAGPGADDALGIRQVERWRPEDVATDRNSDAEYAFYALPARFQRAAEALLLPDERILEFVPWTAAATERWWAALGRRLEPSGRQALTGALVVTDRAILFLRDDAEPAAGSIYWGTRAVATTPERLAAVTAERDRRGRVGLTLTLRAAGGAEGLAWTFGPAAAEDALRAAARLDAFLPCAGDRRVRRLGTVQPWAAPPVSGEGRPDDRWRQDRAAAAMAAARDRFVAGLMAGLARWPGPDGRPRRVLADVVGEEADGPRLLAVTQEHLMVVPPPGGGEPTAFPLAGVTSVALRRSVLGSHLAWVLAAPGGAARVVSLPVLLGEEVAATAAFTALRQALALLPARAAGPDLSDESPAADVPAAPGTGEGAR